MAVKTSLRVETFNPVTNKNVTKTATYSNPNATDAQLKSFAQNFYGGLSDNTVNSVIRVDKQSITNAESDTTPATSNLLSITFNALPEMPNSTNWQSGDVFFRMGGKLQSKSASTFIQTLDWSHDAETNKVSVEYVEHYKSSTKDEDRTETCVIQTFEFLGLSNSPESFYIPCITRESGYPDEESEIWELQGDIIEDLDSDLTVIGMTWNQIFGYIKAGKILKVYAAIANYLITQFRSRYTDEDPTQTTTIDFNVSYDETNNAFIMTATNEDIQEIKMGLDTSWVYELNDLYSTVLDKYSESIQPNITFDASKSRLMFQKTA